MPRGPRLDAPGTLHHIIVRGIEKRKIVDSDKDREDFINRMCKIVLDTGYRYIYICLGVDGQPCSYSTS